jgi:hypothetical protein
MRLIGFHGGMGCGKSTAIESLKSHLGYAPTLIKFAGPLYEMQEFIYNRIAKVYQRPATFVKDRKLLQWLGTDWGRETISENVWVDIWQADVKDAMARGEFVVCDDVRFDNEAQLVRKLGGIVVRIDRLNNQAHAHGGTGIKNHASEAGINADLIDATVFNHGTKEDYQNSLTTLYRVQSIGSE